jgi:cAMP-specific phosphodiesterase 4
MFDNLKKKKFFLIFMKKLFISEFDPTNKDKAICMDSILHAADISNPFKPFHIYDVWCKRVLEEFWQ